MIVVNFTFCQGEDHECQAGLEVCDLATNECVEVQPELARAKRCCGACPPSRSHPRVRRSFLR